MRLLFAGRMWGTAWAALRLDDPPSASEIPALMERLMSVRPTAETNLLDVEDVAPMLIELLAALLNADGVNHRPLLDKLRPYQQRRMERVFDAFFPRAISSDEPFEDHPKSSSWFAIREQHARTRINKMIKSFPTTANWAASAAEQQDQEHWTTRKYRLMPTAAQRRVLKRFMGTCRWTYNQGVAHFKATGKHNKNNLMTLYVANNTSLERSYPEPINPEFPLGSAPEWAYQTPYQFRANAMRMFDSAVNSAFANKAANNTTHFNMNFASKKAHRYFTIQALKRETSIKSHTDASGNTKQFLSIAGVKDIRMVADELPVIGGSVNITVDHGMWYAVIPSQVDPIKRKALNSATALDPGVRCFLTGMDMEGNVCEIAPGTQEKLDRFRKRIADAQRVISMFKSRRKHRYRNYRAYARAKRAFACATARQSNAIKDLHRKACCYLVNRYDTIILPKFSTSELLRSSKAQNHKFNEHLLSLKHFQFRELLRAKCARAGTALIICSEMYTSKTCGRCNSLPDLDLESSSR